MRRCTAAICLSIAAAVFLVAGGVIAEESYPANSAYRYVVSVNITSDTDPQGNVDGRGSLTEKAEELGLSSDEVDQIRGSSGYVVCLGTRYGNPNAGSGVLVGSNRQIVTAAHVFIDKSGQKREPLADCYFWTLAETPQKLFFDFRDGHFQFGTEAGRTTGDPNDYAVVALQSPVIGGVPFPYDRGMVGRDAWILAVSAGQDSPTRTFPEDEPVVQQCRVRDFQYPADAPVQYATDCDMSPGGSGGPVLTRDADGKLVVRGIVTASGQQKLNGQPYDPATGSFARVVSVSKGFANAIEAVRAAVGSAD